MNLEALAEQIGLEPDEYLEMLEIFLETGGNDLERLESAVGNADAESAHEAAHSLKGSSGSLGLDDIFHLARDIDDQVRQGVLDGITDLVTRLRHAYTRLADTTNALLTGD